MSSERRSDERWMARCLELARRAEGRTAPNPMVGAVVVRDGELVGEGWHAQAGGPHAEVLALAAAGDAAMGATLYVSLEPCCHHGRTPPCTESIERAGLARVVAGMGDPNPLVDGKGIEALRAMGIAVRTGVLEEECRALNRAFIKSITTGRPLVALKAASTLDGRIATVAGESKWITGARARQHGHGLRGRFDAILVGANTALADDPRLSCRVEGGRDPLPVLLDSHLRVPASAKIFSGSAQARVYALSEGPPDHPGLVRSVPAAAGGLALEPMLEDLVSQGAHSLLVEGGGQVHRSFLEAGLVDRVYLYLAPLVLGGGASWVAGPGVARLGRAFRLELARSERLGPDLLLVFERG